MQCLRDAGVNGVNCEMGLKGMATQACDMGRRVWVVESTYKSVCYNVYFEEARAQRAVQMFRQAQGDGADYWKPCIVASVAEGQAFGGINDGILTPTQGHDDGSLWIVEALSDDMYEYEYRAYFSENAARAAVAHIGNGRAQRVGGRGIWLRCSGTSPQRCTY